MALTSRVSPTGSELEPAGPEDYLAASLGVIFPDDVTNQHGEAGHSLVYASPHLPAPLRLDLADPVGADDRGLFSHYLWNAGLLLAELVERDTLAGAAGGFDVAGRATIELGAGAALPSIMAGLLGARRVVVTDFPAPAVLATLEANVARNIRPELAPAGRTATPACAVAVRAHAWGDVTDAFCAAERHAFDRVLVADCLWMPAQHANLRRSVAHFLADAPGARCWVVAGFHTGRRAVGGFFAEGPLRDAGLVVERIWERDCAGAERPWALDGEEGIAAGKRWLVVAVLKRTETEEDP